MASSNVTADRVPSPLRREVARVACYEVQILAQMLHEYIEKNDNCGDIAPSMRGSLMRLSALSDIIFEAVITDEPSDSDDELVGSIGGRTVLSEEAQHG